MLLARHGTRSISSVHCVVGILVMKVSRRRTGRHTAENATTKSLPPSVTAARKPSWRASSLPCVLLGTQSALTV